MSLINRVDIAKSKLKNFQSFPLSEAKKSISSYAKSLATHTLLILVYGGSINRYKWETEIFSFLCDMRKSNNVKTPSRKLPHSLISNLIYDHLFGDDGDYEFQTHMALQHMNSDTKKERERISKLNIELAIPYIYDDYVNFISDEIVDEKMKNKISKFYVLPKKD